MARNRKTLFFVRVLLVFTGLPLALLFVGDFPERTLLKESISFVTILSFFMIIGQFYWSRVNYTARAELTGKKLSTVHNLVGYICIAILCFHPFMLVVPRFFEKGLEPTDAFLTIITTFTSKGVVLGLIAWGLMLVLGTTSMLRKRLPMRYLTWRKIHGILSAAFIIAAANHVINLGRHITTPMTLLIIALTGCGIVLLCNDYFIQPITKIGTKR